MRRPVQWKSGIPDFFIDPQGAGRYTFGKYIQEGEHMADWLDNAIFYEIYPQSFQDSNGDGIGDFRGIMRRLDYIRDLGCNAIWMNPCFESPFYDAGYDVTDFYQAAPRYGTNEELRELFEEVHRRGMHILLDLVAGHTSLESPWFKASCRPEQNAYTKRFIWTDSVMEDTGDISGVCGWLRGMADRDGAVAVNCFSTQPALNYGFGNVTKPWQSAADSPEAEEGRRLLEDIMSFWLELGCDGFRVDMAASLVKADPGHRCTKRLWQKVRRFLDTHYPEAVLVSEWGDPKEAIEAGFHMDFLLHNGPTHYMSLFREQPYFSKRGTGDISAFARTYEEHYRSAEGKGLLCIPSGNHDMKRLRDTLDEEEMKLAFVFLLTMPGCPFVYYGDEIGMRYLDGLTSREGGYERTGSRTSMQWENTVNARFYAAPEERLYLPVDPDPARPTVESEKSDPGSLFHVVKELTKLRQSHPALLSGGDIRFLYAEQNAYPFLYERRSAEESLLVILNPADRAGACPLAEEPGEILYFCGSRARREELTWKDGQLRVPPCSAAVCRKKG